MTEPVDADVIRAVVDRARAAGLRDDIPRARLVRAVRTVASASGGDLRAVARPPLVDEAVEQLAIHESWFFRGARQFRALATDIVPALTPPVRVWSIGCADGQEVWSLAMLLSDTVDGDWHVTGTDLSAAAVARASRGVYRSARLRGLSAEYRERFLKPGENDEWVITPSLRRHVTFYRHNVAQQAPPLPPRSCDVVLCRNVLIYLHPDAVAAALSSIEQTMTPEGWLMLGTAESLFGITEEFTATPLHEAFAYRRRAAGPAPVGAGRATARPSPPAALPAVSDLLAQAHQARQQQRPDEAARLFRQAAYLDPDRAEAHAGLADALEAVGDRKGAARARAAARGLRRG